MSIFSPYEVGRKGGKGLPDERSSSASGQRPLLTAALGTIATKGSERASIVRWYGGND